MWFWFYLCSMLYILLIKKDLLLVGDGSLHLLPRQQEYHIGKEVDAVVLTWLKTKKKFFLFQQAALDIYWCRCIHKLINNFIFWRIYLSALLYYIYALRIVQQLAFKFLHNLPLKIQKRKFMCSCWVILNSHGNIFSWGFGFTSSPSFFFVELFHGGYQDFSIEFSEYFSFLSSVPLKSYSHFPCFILIISTNHLTVTKVFKRVQFVYLSIKYNILIV